MGVLLYYSLVSNFELFHFVKSTPQLCGGWVRRTQNALVAFAVVGVRGGCGCRTEDGFFYLSWWMWVCCCFVLLCLAHLYEWERLCKHLKIWQFQGLSLKWGNSTLAQCWPDCKSVLWLCWQSSGSSTVGQTHGQRNQCRDIHVAAIPVSQQRRMAK